MKNYILYLINIFLFFFIIGNTSLSAQNKRVNKKRNTTVNINFASKVVNGFNEPISDAIITIDGGEKTVLTDNNGSFKIAVNSNSIVLVEAIGYKDTIFFFFFGVYPEQIKLRSDDNSTYISRGAWNSTLSKYMTGSSSGISGEELSTYPDYSLSNTLQGHLSGVVASANVGGLGLNASSIYVRGLHGYTNNGALVIVDGMEREWNDIIPEEVEKIEAMKDAVAKILYGPRAANGVLVITTKRGKENKRTIKTSIEAGVMLASRTPEYLNSYQYASLYNEARMNDGLQPFYSDKQLEGYKNSTGPNDVFYPDVDYSNLFLHNQSMYRKAIFEMNGGSGRIKYSLITNYIGGNGFEKVGDRPDLNRFNVRGNLDIKATDYINIFADASARLELKSWGSVSSSDVYNKISTIPSNEFPILIDPNIINMELSEDGVPFMGGSIRRPNNLYADMKYGGYTDERYILSQTNLGIDFNLDMILKGLSAKGYVTFDNYSMYRKGQRDVYPTYALLNRNDDFYPQFVQLRKYVPQSDMSQLAEQAYRTTGWNFSTSYDTKIYNHKISAIFAYNYFNKENKGEVQDIKNSNMYLDFNYSYKNKYLFEGVYSMLGSNKFSQKNRYFSGGAIGMGWILSEEEWLMNNNWVNFLKLKFSCGILGYDKNVDDLLYNTAWKNGGNVNFGERAVTVYPSTNFVRIGNENLKWETSKELNIGIETLMLDNRLSFEANYFSEKRDDIIGLNTSKYQDMLGNFVSYSNMGSVLNNGFDFFVKWNDRIADFKYQVGANLVWSKNKLLSWNEVEYPDEDVRTVGKPTDVMIGYNAIGLFGRDVDLNNGIYQSLGDYKEGDVAYRDLNDDKVIDSGDRTVLGNWFPRTSLGIDLNLNYKGWNLYILGTSELGLDVWKNNSYYWNRAEDKYSVQALNSYHPQRNPNGEYPRLTTTQGSNNFVNSSLWVENGSFFRLKNIELSYTFDFKRKYKTCKELRLFARGTNLFVISEEKNLDPEDMNAGVTNYPMYKTLTAGLCVTF